MSQASNPFTTTLSRPLRQYDYGFFGPGSPSWKVWTHPTAAIGFQRAVVLEHFDPFLTAGAADQAGIYKDPQGRLDRTFAYFLLVALADSRTVIEASEFLMKIHARVTGIEPVSGKRYAANNPDSQLWIHVTGWQSVLKAYEMFGPGKLSAEEEAQYWRECAIAAEVQTCRQEDVPKSREEVRAYYARIRSTLCVTERARQGMEHLLRPARADVGIKLSVVGNLIALATIATLPRWMRQLGQIDQPHLVDRLIRPIARVLVLLSSPVSARITLLGMATPLASKILKQHFRSGEPENTAILSPTEAREHFGEEAKRAAAAAHAQEKALLAAAG
ncbi:MAG: oxygenase MpaB family protein [Pedobacter sp.]|nr:oxygenase MpaB family protein [Pedobacter sp.]